MTWWVEMPKGGRFPLAGPRFNAADFGPGDYWVVGPFGDYRAEFRVSITP